MHYFLNACCDVVHLHSFKRPALNSIRFIQTVEKLDDPEYDQRYGQSVNAARATECLLFYFYLILLYSCIVSMAFLPWKIRVAFPGES